MTEPEKFLTIATAVYFIFAALIAYLWKVGKKQDKKDKKEVQAD